MLFYGFRFFLFFLSLRLLVHSVSHFAAALSQYSSKYVCFNKVRMWDFTCLAIFPPLQLGCAFALFNGTTTVIRKKFSASNFWRECAQHGCTVSQVVKRHTNSDTFL